MIKFKVITSGEAEEFEEEVGNFLEDIKPENLIKISTSVESDLECAGAPWFVALITYKI